MKVKVSDFIADFFVTHGIKTIFTVVGGGAMHMNNSFGHHPNLTCIYNHHEQASSMAAEAYYRINNEMAGVCVTSGPGAINALNGVAGAYQDSIPMIVVSGQCKSTLTTRKTGLNLRTLGPQEFDIIAGLKYYTKYAESIMDEKDLLYCLEKAFYLAQNGRPGPCWLEIPIDIQGKTVEVNDLKHFDLAELAISQKDNLKEKVKTVITKLQTAQRPVIYAGNGVRIAKAVDCLHRVAEKYNIPIVTCWNSIDLIATDDKYYAGRAGTMGDRSGNFAVQNSDLLIVVGSRLNTYQVGYQLESWARNAYVVAADIDPNELAKPTIRVDLPICCDAKEFLEQLLTGRMFNQPVDCNAWLSKCSEWKNKYPVVNDNQRNQNSPLNVYGFIDYLSKHLPHNSVTVAANGSASVAGSQTYYLKKGDRFIINCALSSMGYDLPAAIGACIANQRKPIICIAGDGSIQMNIQELQTIVTNSLPIKIIIINNQGYQQIRITQTNLFDSNFVGVGPVSKDLGFPDFSKLAEAYGIPYKRCDNKQSLPETIKWMNEVQTYCMVEAVCDTKQAFEPKSATKKLADGSLYSPPLEDLAPFITREELKQNMYIPLWDEKDK